MPPTTSSPPEGLARALGVVSLALGLPQVLAPDRVLAQAGFRDGTLEKNLARAVGARELLHAAGLLAPRSHPAWVWTRVAGDAMDLSLLGNSLVTSRGGEQRARRAVATGLVAAVTAVDLYAALRQRRSVAVHLESTTTIRKSPDQVYAAWRDLSRLPEFMAHLEEVRETGSGRSRWTATAPFGRTVSWDAETTADEPGQRLAWRSVGSTPVGNEGEVRFVPAPGDRGTEVHVSISYHVPGGALGRVAARYWGEEPHQQLDDDLRRFKQVVETGEVVRSEGAPGGKRARREFPQHAAQPLTEHERQEVGL